VSSVLLTGARGFVGSNAIDPLLAAGHEVHAVSRLPGKRKDVQWHSVDLLDPRAVEVLVEQIRPEMLLHFAWYAEHGLFWNATENLDWVGATLRLMQCFSENDGRRAVVAGTCAEYGWGESPCSEACTKLLPATLYGVAKNATNQVASAFARERRFELAWGRIFFVYGPGENPRRLLPTVARNLIAGRAADTTDGEQIRDFMHVADVARGFVALLDSPVTGSVNVASGQPVKVRRLIELVAESVGGPDLVRRGALARSPGDPESIVADVTRLNVEVGYQPRVDLERGVTEVVEWWQNQKRPL
jgi:nucleoside-diphosphate-sugar epimerase